MAFVCNEEDCDAKFKRKQQLKEHKRWHSGDLLYCDHIDNHGNKCKSVFDANWKLTNHKKNHQFIQCYTCGNTYTKKRYPNHQCGIKPGPKPAHKTFSADGIQNIKKQIDEQDKKSPYPLNSTQIKNLMASEANKENISIFKPSNAKHKRHQNITIVKTFAKEIGYNMRSNNSRKRFFKPISDRQILQRSETDADIFQHISTDLYDNIQQTYVITAKNKKKKRRKAAKRDVRCGKRAMTYQDKLSERKRIQEEKRKNKLKKKKKKKHKKKEKWQICFSCRHEKLSNSGKRRKSTGKWYCLDCTSKEKVCCDHCNKLKYDDKGQWDKNELWFICFRCLYRAPTPNAAATESMNDMEDASEIIGGNIEHDLDENIENMDNSGDNNMDISGANNINVNNMNMDDNSGDTNMENSINNMLNEDEIFEFVDEIVKDLGNCDVKTILHSFAEKYGFCSTYVKNKVYIKLEHVLKNKYDGAALFEQRRKQLGYTFSDEE